MTVDMDKIKARIDHMLRIASNEASTDGEVAAAMGMAESLMRKHNLSREDVIVAGDGTIDVDNVEFGKQDITMVGVQRTGWEMELATFLEKFVGTVRSYYKTKAIRVEPDGTTVDGKGRGAVVTFYGPKDDVRMACELFRDMGVRIAHSGKTKFGGFARGEGKDYCHGFVNGLKRANKVAEKKRLASATPGEHALIVQNHAITTQLASEAKTWLSDVAGIKLYSGSGCTGGRSGSAYSAGQADGSATKMTKTRQARLR